MFLLWILIIIITYRPKAILMLWELEKFSHVFQSRHNPNHIQILQMSSERLAFFILYMNKKSSHYCRSLDYYDTLIYEMRGRVTNVF